MDLCLLEITSIRMSTPDFSAVKTEANLYVIFMDMPFVIV